MKIRVYLVLAIMIASLVAGAALAQTPEASTRHYYTGTIGDLKVQLDLSLEGELVSGHYYYERVGVPLSLEGSRQELRLELVEKSEDGVVTGRFSGELSSPWQDTETMSTWQEPGLVLSGSWHSPDGRELPFTLQKAAGFVSIETRQGELIEVSSLYPQFSLAALGPVNHWLQEQALSRHIAFMEEGQEALAEGMFFHGWWLFETHEIHYYAEDLVSLLIEHNIYTGGAHPNLWFGAVNIWLQEGVQVLDLTDLFRPGAPYLKRLSDYLIAELQGQEAGWVAFGELTEFDLDRLTVFTFGPQGLSFHFAPYEVGAYAEGPYVVTVPFEVLADLIEPSGPLGRFLR